jgi:hypothetical protein
MDIIAGNGEFSRAVGATSQPRAFFSSPLSTTSVMNSRRLMGFLAQEIIFEYRYYAQGSNGYPA